MTNSPLRLLFAHVPGLAIAGLLVLDPARALAAPPDADSSDAAPEGEQPEVEQPEADAADAEQPEADAPEAEQPEASPEGPQPEGPQPEVEQELASPTEPKPTPPPTPSAIGDKHSIQYTSLLAPRINPLGLEERLWIGYQYRLYNKDKAILNGSNISIFFRPVVSPAIVLVGPTIQIQPAAVLRLRASYAYVQYLGTFQFMQSYQSPYDDYSETRLDEQSEVGQNYVVGGHQVELEALVQARYKGLVLRSATTGIYNNFDLRGDDDLFYAVRYDILTSGKGWLLANDTDLLWLQDMKGPRKATLMFGARATTLMPFFKDEVYEEGDVIDNPVGPQFRLGPALGYIFYDKPERKFNKPTLLLMPQWNIKHRWRTGRDVSTAFPTIVIAFAFSGQLWGKN